MSHQTAAIILIFILLAIIVIMIVSHKWIKRFTNQYIFWLVISLILFTWLVAFRYAGHWIEVTNGYINHTWTDPTTPEQSNAISKAFMLDVCPFCALLLPVSLIFDPSRKVARSISPVTLFGAAFVMCVQMPFNSNVELTARYIFYGDELYFFIHAVNILLPIGVLLNTPRFDKKGTIMSYSITAGMYIYFLIIAAITGCRWHTSGVTGWDFHPDGEYAGVTHFFHLESKWYLMPIIYYPMGAAALIFPIHLCDYVFKRFKTFAYPEKRAKQWYNGYVFNDKK